MRPRIQSRELGTRWERAPARLAADTPRGGSLDYLVDSPMTCDQASFQDLDHYRAPVARRIEAEIAGILKGQAAQTK